MVQEVQSSKFVIREEDGEVDEEVGGKGSEGVEVPRRVWIKVLRKLAKEGELGMK